MCIEVKPYTFNTSERIPLKVVFYKTKFPPIRVNKAYESDISKILGFFRL